MKAVIPFLNIQLPFKDASIQKAFVAKAETQSSTNEGFRCCGNIVSVLWTDGGMENLRGGGGSENVILFISMLKLVRSISSI